MFRRSARIHADVRVLEEHVICSSERVILPFCLKNMDEVDRIWRETEMSSFLLDHTFQTNKEGLLLGAVGPVGLTVSSRGPSMRFLPVLFMLASSEDSDAHYLMLFWTAAVSMQWRLRAGRSIWA